METVEPRKAQPWWHVNTVERTKEAQYVVNVVTALSRLGNALSGGSPDVSISERVGAGAARGDVLCKQVLAPFIDTILLEPGHCDKAVRMGRRIRSHNG